MATPFTKITMSEGKARPEEAGGRVLSDADPKDDKKPKPHCKACTDFKTWMELTAHPRRVSTLCCQFI